MEPERFITQNKLVVKNMDLSSFSDHEKKKKFQLGVFVQIRHTSIQKYPHVSVEWRSWTKCHRARLLPNFWRSYQGCVCLHWTDTPSTSSALPAFLIRATTTTAKVSTRWSTRRSVMRDAGSAACPSKILVRHTTAWRSATPCVCVYVCMYVCMYVCVHAHS